MQTFGAFEAKTYFSALLKRVEKGEQVIITKHGRAVARLIPVAKSSHVRTRQIINELKVLSQSSTLALDWKKLREEGRR